MSTEVNSRIGSKTVLELILFCAANTTMLTILLVILLLMALGALPAWPYSRGWGYYPSGGLGLVLVILVVLLLIGRI
jgi:Protein of unknown function (DUF3309)